MLARYFPEIAAAVAKQLRGQVVLDGELVVTRGGRLDFAALQGRLHASAARARELSITPACFVAFDLLAPSGRDLRTTPLHTRRARLAGLLANAVEPLVLMPMTTNRKAPEHWLTDHAEAGVESVVAKPLDHAHRPGGRSWQKVRTRRTTEALVGGVFGTLAIPDALVIGPTRRVDFESRAEPANSRRRARVAGPAARPWTSCSARCAPGRPVPPPTPTGLVPASTRRSRVARCRSPRRRSRRVLRDIVFGDRRYFRELQANSIEGIASNSLAARLKRLVESGLLTREDTRPGQRARYSMTERAIQLVPVFAQLGSWGLRHRPTSSALRVRGELLEQGGPALWHECMDELRHSHLDSESPARSPSVRERLAATNTS